MYNDKYGNPIYTENDLCELFLKNTELKISNILTNDDIDISNILELEYLPHLIKYIDPNLPIHVFDNNMQKNWHIPDDYKNMDIAKYILDLCQTEEELQRAGQELLLFQERDMFILLKYLKYLVDTMRNHNIVWGVGRGSSVASFVLFLLGVHKINSLYYDISIDEFIK